MAQPTNQTSNDLLQQASSEENAYLNVLAEKAHDKEVAEQAKAARIAAKLEANKEHEAAKAQAEASRKAGFDAGNHKDNILNDVLKATGPQPTFGMDGSDRAVSRRELVRTAFIRWELVHGHVPKDQIAEMQKRNDETIKTFSPHEKDALRYLGGAFNKHQNDPQFHNVIGDILKSNPVTIDSAALQARFGHFQNYSAPFNNGFLASHHQAIGAPSHSVAPAAVAHADQPHIAPSGHAASAPATHPDHSPVPAHDAAGGTAHDAVPTKSGVHKHHHRHHHMKAMAAAQTSVIGANGLPTAPIAYDSLSGSENNNTFAFAGKANARAQRFAMRTGQSEAPATAVSQSPNSEITMTALPDITPANKAPSITSATTVQPSMKFAPTMTI